MTSYYNDCITFKILFSTNTASVSSDSLNSCHHLACGLSQRIFKSNNLGSVSLQPFDHSEKRTFIEDQVDIEASATVFLTCERRRTPLSSAFSRLS